MEILLKQPDAIPVSLGWSCHMALYIQELGDMERRRHERHVFDWFGSPMWSICELIDMDFEGMTDRTKIIPRRRYMDNFKEILSHTEYELRFLHDFKDENNITDDDWSQFEEKYARRIQRFRDLLTMAKQTNKKLIFFRLEQVFHRRIQYINRFENETFYVNYFADQMRQKGIRFQIIYLTTSVPTHYRNNVIYVQFGKKAPDMEVGFNQIQEIVKENLTYIREALKAV
jgi:hypothetical protein